MALVEAREANGSDLISALHLSQQAPAILGHNPANAGVTSSRSSADTAEEYGRIERLFLACLRTGDDKSAHACLDRLSERFGPSNERVMGLRGLYEEATAKDNAALAKCLEEYEKILANNPVNVPIMKRRVALLRSLNRVSDAITALIQLLDAVPTDAEAWCELADLYQSQGLGAQAIFSLEEALLIAPNSWNIHARLGELLYVCASSADSDAPRLAGKSVQHFCRSIELCDDYLRGFYGLILASSHMLEKEYAHEKFPEAVTASKTTLTQLKSLGLQKLGDIVRSRSVDDQHWASSRSELIAAKELLNQFEKSP
jgi:tetratricopeptide (TPR) repeat protein